MSTAHHLLSTLLAHGYVEQDPKTGFYRLGQGALVLAHQFLGSYNLDALAAPHLVCLHEQFDEWTFLNVLRGGWSISISTIQSKRPLVINHPVGRVGELHCSSSGKVLLSGLDEHQAEALLREQGLSRLTPQTIVDPDLLRAELRRIRAHGFAVNREESREGLVGFAAPVYDATGRVVAACGLGVPTIRMSPARERAIIHAVRRCGAAISLRLGYAPAAETLSALGATVSEEGAASHTDDELRQHPPV